MKDFMNKKYVTQTLLSTIIYIPGNKNANTNR